jgi:hypothetical protein
MNWNWYTIRRLRGALILILLGVVFLLNESDWFHFDVWPLFFIGLGIILLAERLIPMPPPPPPGTVYPPYTGSQYPYGYPPQPQYPYTQTPPPTQAAPAAENPTSDSPTGEWR